MFTRIAFTFLLAYGIAWGTTFTYTVDTPDDTAPTTGGKPSSTCGSTVGCPTGDLRFVLNQIQAGQASNTGGGNTWEIVFSSVSSVTLADPLPVINLLMPLNPDTVTISGPSAATPVTIDGAGSTRIFLASQGNVTLQNLILQNGLATGGTGGSGANAGAGGGGGMGAGGALFVDSAIVTLDNVDFRSTTNPGMGATGGNGGSTGSPLNLQYNGGGGGGGGIGANGGMGGGTNNGSGCFGVGGGGGGYSGNGGRGGSGKFHGGAGGGGGAIGNGGDGSDGDNGSTSAPGGRPGGGGGGGSIIGANGGGVNGGTNPTPHPGNGQSGSAIILNVNLGTPLFGGGGAGGNVNGTTATAGGFGGGTNAGASGPPGIGTLISGGGGGGSGSSSSPGTTGGSGSGNANGGNGGIGGGGGGGGNSSSSGGNGGLGGIGGGGGGGANFGVGSGTGGVGGYCGGGGGGCVSSGGIGGFGGGGGGSPPGTGGSAASGGFGGGGGGGGGDISISGDQVSGGNGGFGGGGGGAGRNASGGIGGVGAGSGANNLSSNPGGGGGGSALGGAIFLNSGTIKFQSSNAVSPSVVGGTLTAGSGGTSTSGLSGFAGGAAGTSIFLVTGSTLNFSPISGETITVNGTIADDSANSLPGTPYQPGTGTGASLMKQNPGKLVLNGTNTYAGSTSVTGGILSVSSDTNLGISSGNLSINAATLQITQNGFISGRPITLTSSSTFDITTGTSTLNGLISGTGQLSKTDGGTLNLTDASNGYSGGTQITGGTLSISADGCLGNASGVFTSISSGAVLEAASPTSSSRNFKVGPSPGGMFAQGSSSVNHVIGGAISDLSTLGVLNQTGPGTLTLSGANGYTGSTTISGGTLSIGADNNLGAAGTAVTIDSGATLNVTNTFSTTRAFTTNNGIFSQSSSNAYTITGTISGSTLNQSGPGTLVLENASNNTYSGGTNIAGGTLSLGNTNEQNLGTGPVTLQNGSTLNATQTPSAPSARSYFLGGGVFSQASFGVTYTISGQIQDLTSGGILTQNGLGTLVLSNNSNSYSGATTINAGTLSLLGGGLLPSSTSVSVASSATLDVSDASSNSQTIADLSGAGTVTLGLTHLTTGASNASTTFSGDFLGPGTLTKVGSGKFTLTGNSPFFNGNVIVNEGNLALIGTTASDFQVNSGGTLSGTGTTSGAVNNQGTVSPGQSVGVITFGSYTANSNSTTAIEVSPAAASEIITNPGSITIDPGAILALTFDPGIYAMNSSYTILAATGGGNLTGTFTTVTGKLPGFRFGFEYLADSLVLVLEPGSLSPIIQGGNAGAVANAIDALLPTASGDLLNVINSLFLLTDDPANLRAALNQMQPSIFKGLALSQENAMIRVKDPFVYRMHEFYWVDCIRECCACGAPNLWAMGIGDYLNQTMQRGQTGFHTFTSGGVIGADFGCYNGAFFGTGFAYTHTDVRWSKSQAKADIDSYYGALYSGWFNDFFYVEGAVLAAYNSYVASRKLISVVFNRVADNKHGGFEVDGTFGLGFIIDTCPIEARPFDQFDYIYLYEGDFTEHGANSLNLHVHSDVYTLMRNELGVSFAKCWLMDCYTVVPEIKLSWIYERRFQGRHYTAEFLGTDVPFVVSGMKPTRNLGSLSLGFSGYYLDDDFLWSLYWDSEYGEHFMDQNLNLEISYRF